VKRFALLVALAAGIAVFLLVPSTTPLSAQAADGAGPLVGSTQGRQGAGAGAQGNRGGQRQGGAQGGDRQGGPGGGGFFRGRGEPPTGTASIRGQVTSDTGAPIRRAQVRASAAGAGPARLAATDADGRFELRDLPAGQWALTASKPGYVAQRLGQRRPNETVPPIELADGQRFGGANFGLMRGGAIVGRVFDDFGDPIAGARVQALRSQFVNGRRRLTPVAGSDESDDTGAFRLYGLAPGEYYVSATLRASGIDAPNNQTGYSPTYFPGTGNVSEAERVVLAAGQEQTVGFGLQPVRTVRVSGTAISSTGAPLDGGIVSLTSADADDAPIDGATAARIAANGTFTITNVAPGSYQLGIAAGAGLFGGRGGRGRAAVASGAEPEVASMVVAVGAEDVTGLAIATTRGASIDGRVVIEGAGAPPNLTSIQISARALRATPGIGGGQNSRVSAEGAFHLSSLIGRFAVRVDGLPPQWIVKSVTVNDTNVTDGSMELRGTEQIAGARIVLTDRIAELNGAVTLDGQPARDAAVIVFADEPARWTFPTRYVRTTRTNQAGAFTLRGLPPSSYRAVAVTYLEDGEWQDPAFLERMQDAATATTLRDGETRTVDLKLVDR
jgi:hypothetical protein